MKVWQAHQLEEPAGHVLIYPAIGRHNKVALRDALWNLFDLVSSRNVSVYGFVVVHVREPNRSVAVLSGGYIIATPVVVREIHLLTKRNGTVGTHAKHPLCNVKNDAAFVKRRSNAIPLFIQ